MPSSHIDNNAPENSPIEWINNTRELLPKGQLVYFVAYLIHFDLCQSEIYKNRS